MIYNTLKQHTRYIIRKASVLLMLPLFLSTQANSMDYLESATSHVYNNRYMYATAGLLLASTYLIPGAEATSQCPNDLSPLYGNPNKGLFPLVQFLEDNTRVEAIRGIFNGRELEGNDLATTLKTISDTWAPYCNNNYSVCPHLPLVPEFSFSNTLLGIRLCVYNMGQYASGNEGIQTLYTILTGQGN